MSSFKPGALAGAAAALPSGVPSTAWALLRGRDPLEATLAAGLLLLPRERRRGRLVLAAAPVHLALSAAWGIVLAHALPRPTAARGAVAGLVIATLDLGLVGRRLPRVRALPLLPQLADHVVYGAIVGALLRKGREGRPARLAPPSDP